MYIYIYLLRHLSLNGKLLSILKYNKPNMNMLTAYIYHRDKNITLRTYSVVVTVNIKN